MMTKTFTKSTPDGKITTALVCQCPLSGAECIRQTPEGKTLCLSMDIDAGINSMQWCPVMQLSFSGTIPLNINLGSIQETPAMVVTEKIEPTKGKGR